MATKNSKPPRVSLLNVSTPAGQAGRLTKNGQHAFTYDTDPISLGDRSLEISLTMPLRPESFNTTPMLPVFQTFLPEGFLRERIAERFGKTVRIDDMAMLAFSGQNAIGRLRVSNQASPSEPKVGVESLKEILDDQGTRDLFEYLSDKYLIASGIAGVQPKVLVATEEPEDASKTPLKPSLGERATLRVRQLIVKVSSSDYPGLSENEFHCLEIARTLGLDVPSFWMSDDRKRLAIERFDYDRDRERYLGFEDMVSLQGTTNDRKYEGSYEGVALAIANNASPPHKNRSLSAYFSSLVLSMALRNGDAHLKNFGMLYTDPGTDDCRFAPIYDIVCTTMYIPKDKPALSMRGRREWPDRKTLADFGRATCFVDRPELEIERIVDGINSYKPEDSNSDVWPQLRKSIDVAMHSLGASDQIQAGH